MQKVRRRYGNGMFGTRGDDRRLGMAVYFALQTSARVHE